MKLIIATHEYPPMKGGAGVGVRNLAEALVVSGHRVTVITAGADQRARVESGVDVRRLSCGFRSDELAGPGVWMRFILRAPDAVASVSREIDPDVVASFFPVVAGFAVARSKCAIPHATTFIGADIHDPTRPWVAADRNPVVRSLIRRAVRHAAAVTALSRDMVRRAQSIFPDTKIHRIPLGVWLPDHREQPAGVSRPLGDGSVRVVSACRMVKRKRLDLLLDALALVDDLVVDSVLIGDGPELPELRRRTNRLGLGDRVRFTGWIDEAAKAAHLAEADVYCMPSDHEAQGLALIEAMALGTAAIVSDSGGQTDIVRDGVDGFIVTKGDARSIADRLREFVAVPETLESMQQSARQRAQRFSAARSAEDFLALYRTISDRNRGHE